MLPLCTYRRVRLSRLQLIAHVFYVYESVLRLTGNWQTAVELDHQQKCHFHQ